MNAIIIVLIGNEANHHGIIMATRAVGHGKRASQPAAAPPMVNELLESLSALSFGNGNGLLTKPSLISPAAKSGNMQRMLADSIDTLSHELTYMVRLSPSGGRR